MTTQLYKNDKELVSKLEPIIIHLSKEEQDKIKEAAKSAGMSVKKYVLRAVKEKINAEANGFPAQHGSSIHANLDVNADTLAKNEELYMPHSAGEEAFSLEEEAYIIRVMQESHAKIPTISEYERLSDETQMHTTQRLLTLRRDAIERLKIRRYVAEIMG